MLTLGLAASIFAQTIPPPPDIQHRVDALFRDYDKPGLPGCIIGVARNSELIYWRGYGYDTTLSRRPLDSDTVFEVGPLSTNLIQAALSELSKQRRLSFDENIRLRIPEMPEYEAPMRIRDLLEGRSKLRSYGELFELVLHDPNNHQDDPQVFEIIVRQKGLAVGSSLGRMNDTESFLLSKIVERSIGISLSRFVRERFFVTRNMPNTTIGEPRNKADTDRRHHAVYTTLRDVAGWIGRSSYPWFDPAAVHQSDGHVNRLAPSLRLLHAGMLVVLCNS